MMTFGPADRPDPADDALGLAAFRQLPEQAGLTLNQLSEALAGMLRSGDDPYAAGDPSQEADSERAGVADDARDDSPITPRSILEALLFVGSPKNEPLTSQHVASMMRGVRPAEIDALVRELNRDYRRRNCPYTIVSEGAGYRLALVEQYFPLRDKFYGRVRQARLSQAAIEVLAAAAYNGPITAEEVSRLRGTPSGHVLLQLVRRQLLRVDRDPAKPRQARYATTDRFLNLFGLASLDDLPRSTDLEEA